MMATVLLAVQRLVRLTTPAMPSSAASFCSPSWWRVKRAIRAAMRSLIHASPLAFHQGTQTADEHGEQEDLLHAGEALIDVLAELAEGVSAKQPTPPAARMPSPSTMKTFMPERASTRISR
jgi:hypothetical protein